MPELAELMMHADRSVTCIRRAQTARDYFDTLDVDREFTENIDRMFEND